MKTFVTLASTPSSASLIISLIFGLGQCGVGAVLVVRAARHGAWRRAGIFATGIFGAWAICSGLAELVVSGYAQSMEVGGSAGPHALTAVRHAADTSLLVVSGILLVPLCVYPLWRYMTRRRTPSGAAPHSARED